MPSEYARVGRRSDGSSPTCVQHLRDPAARRSAARPAVRRRSRRAEARLARPDRCGYAPGPSTRAPTCGSTVRRARRHRLAQHLGLARGRQHQARAASGRSSSCPSRSRRGSRRRRPRRPPGRSRRPRAARRSAWSARGSGSPRGLPSLTSRQQLGRRPAAGVCRRSTVPASRKAPLPRSRRGRDQQPTGSDRQPMRADRRSPARRRCRAGVAAAAGRPDRAAGARTAWSARSRTRRPRPASVAGSGRQTGQASRQVEGGEGVGRGGHVDRLVVDSRWMPCRRGRTGWSRAAGAVWSTLRQRGRQDRARGAARRTARRPAAGRWSDRPRRRRG